VRKFAVFCLLLILALPAIAVEDGQVLYVGGTAPGLTAGVVGKLDMTPETSLTFEYAGNKLAIPYASIESFEYSREVTHHPGVLPAIAIGMVKMRRHRHYFRISFHGEDGVTQVVIFEAPKQMPRTLQEVLRARSPHKCPRCTRSDQH
jgi:hypothetical protein